MEKMKFNVEAKVILIERKAAVGTYGSASSHSPT